MSADLPSHVNKTDSLYQPNSKSPVFNSSKKRDHLRSSIQLKALTKPQFLKNIQRPRGQGLSRADEEPPNEKEILKANRKKMWGWIITTLLTLISMFTGALLLFFSPFALALLIPTLLLLPIAASLTTAYIVEHVALSSGSQFLTEERKARLRERGDYWLKNLKTTAAIIALTFIVAFVISAQSGTIGTLLLLLIGILFLAFMVAYWISIVCQVLTLDDSYVERSRLVQTILSPLLLAFLLGILGTMVLFFFNSIV